MEHSWFDLVICHIVCYLAVSGNAVQFLSMINYKNQFAVTSNDSMLHAGFHL